MNSTHIRFISILLIGILITAELASTQRSSNGRHRNWNSEEDLQPAVGASLTLGENLVIHQNVPPKSHQNGADLNKPMNATIVVKLDERPSINLTPEPLPAEILKVDLSKSAMLIVSSSPSYLLTNQTAEQELARAEQQHRSNESGRNINFVQQNRGNPNLATKNCLSTLDCNLELNERCLLPEYEEAVYYEELAKVQPYTSIYSSYLRKKYRNLKADGRRADRASMQQPICGCAPSFVRNQNSGVCELLRVVELRFRVRTDRPSAEQNFNFEAASRTASQSASQAASQTASFRRQSESNLHQLKLDALAQIDYVMKNSDSLHDIVHHFRLTELVLMRSKTAADADRSAEEAGPEAAGSLKKRRATRDLSGGSKRTVAELARRRMQNQYIARGLLLIFSSEYTTNFDLLFTNEYCSTQNTLRMRAQEQMINQALAATNQTWPAIHFDSPRFNTIRSADFWMSLNETSEDVENQSDRIVRLHRHRTNSRPANRSEQRKLVELPFLHHRKRREANESAERYGLDVQLIEVNSDQINICTLNSNYANEQLNDARRRLGLNEEAEKPDNSSTSRSIELERKQKQLEYERRFFRLIYCDDSRAFCNSLPRSRAGYVCVCHSNLMDLSPLMELPGGRD